MQSVEAPALAGEKVRLRPVSSGDAALLARWFSDAEVAYWTHLSEDPPDSHTVEAHRERLERILSEAGRQAWIIETLEEKPIGDLGLMAVNAQHRRAELGVSIGEKEYWSQGYGTDAIRTALRYAFGGMGLRRVYLITDEDNARGIRCYEKCGFVREGILRGHRLRHGGPLDMVVMGVLREEFEGRTWR